MRKRQRLTQQQLADRLGVKRSNIAAYETKNVEPRLTLINDMAQLFRISLSDFITVDLEQRQDTVTKDATPSTGSGLVPPRGNQLARLRERNSEIISMLEGFRVFYEYKQSAREFALIPGDVDNFLILIHNMLDYNRDLGEYFTPATDGTPAARTAAEPSSSAAAFPGRESKLGQ